MASFCSWERTGLVILPVYKLNEATASPRRMVSVKLGLMSLTRLIFIRPGDAFEIIKSEKSKCAPTNPTIMHFVGKQSQRITK